MTSLDYYLYPDEVTGECNDLEPLAKIVPSTKEGLSVFFLSNTPPQSPDPDSTKQCRIGDYSSECNQQYCIGDWSDYVDSNHHRIWRSSTGAESSNQCPIGSSNDGTASNQFHTGKSSDVIYANREECFVKNSSEASLDVMMNTCVIPISQTDEEVRSSGDRRERDFVHGVDTDLDYNGCLGMSSARQGKSSIRQGTSTTNQGVSSCVIVVAGGDCGTNDNNTYALQGVPCESTTVKTSSTCNPCESPPSSCYSNVSGEPSARIVLKGSIAFTHDGVGSNNAPQETKTDSHFAQKIISATKELNERGKESLKPLANGATDTRTLSTSYLESFLPEAPPRSRRSRSRLSSDSAIYIGGDSEGDDLRGTWDSNCSHSLVLNLGYCDDYGRYGKEDDYEDDEDEEEEELQLPILCDPTDTEDDSVFTGDTQDPHRLCYTHDDAPNNLTQPHTNHRKDVATNSPLTRPQDVSATNLATSRTSHNEVPNIPAPPPPSQAEKCTSASDFIRKTMLMSTGDDDDIILSTNQNESTYASLPTQINSPVPPSEVKEPNNLKDLGKFDITWKVKKKKEDTGNEIEDNERQMVNIEFITKETPTDSDDWAPSPPPRTRPSRKHRARSSSPQRSHVPRECSHPRRSRSCCLHYRNTLRQQELLLERGLGPKSLLDAFLTGFQPDDDLGSLPWDYKFCPLYQMQRSTGGITLVGGDRLTPHG
ncbi:hypothetical protein Pcinc_035835 [Petrolisthes cinctipes]|uniref:Uncharacterized protein n=1 Tax=Petrolisthes cinctipes TaxID=88211 RepID=A0AAE1BVY3_PETCI|nr:hypothetical protein Pcinc_035835 [Petrolisthes cinctipes]